MVLLGPEDYRAFACLKGACRHSCCKGWEIDIDADTLERYRTLGGPLGERMREAVDWQGDPPHFRLDGEERCPFLNREGLCDVILTAGEGALCQICADHPRYRHVYRGAEEIGLGLCCEAAARQCLTRREPLRLGVLAGAPSEDTPWEELLSPEEAALWALRQELLSILQDRRKPYPQRVRRLMDRCGLALPGGSLDRWADFLLTLERLEDSWTERLTALSRRGGPEKPLPTSWDLPMEQLTAALLCRHLPGALLDGDVSGRILLACQGARIVAGLFDLTGLCRLDELVDIVRQFSAEIEYSDHNVSALLDALDEGGLP